MTHSAIDWQRIVRDNTQQIVQAARQVKDAGEPVCVLFDIDDVQAGRATPGALRLIADTKLQAASPLNDSQSNRRLVCLPVSRERLLQCLEHHEDVTELRKRIRSGGTLALWTICLDGTDRTLLDIHVVSPEHN